MADSPILGFPLPSSFQNNKITSIDDALLWLEQAANAVLVYSMTGDQTLTPLEYTKHLVFVIDDGGLAADPTLTVPAGVRMFAVRNPTGFIITVGGPSGRTVDVGPGAGAIIVNDSANCDVFGSGGIGAAGPRGPAGGGITWTDGFSSTTTNADPGSGTLRLNNATQHSATAIYISETDDAGNDWSAVLDALDDATSSDKGQIRLYKVSDATHFLVFQLSAVVSHTGYRELTVANLMYSTGSPFTNGDNIGFIFARTGDAPLAEINVWTKPQREAVTVLVDGGTITPDFDDGQNFSLTIAGNRTLANPTNGPGAGITQTGQIIVTEDATGGRTLALGSAWKLAGGGSLVPLNTGANKVTILSYVWISSSYIALSVWAE